MHSQMFLLNHASNTSMGKDQKHIYLRAVGEIIVINRCIDKFGSILNVICIAPTSSKKEV